MIPVYLGRVNFPKLAVAIFGSTADSGAELHSKACDVSTMANSDVTVKFRVLSRVFWGNWLEGCYIVFWIQEWGNGYKLGIWRRT